VINLAEGAPGASAAREDAMPTFGELLPVWIAPRLPDAPVIEGRFARLERLDAGAHAADLHAANRADDAIWDYLPYGPFEDAAGYRTWAEAMAAQDDPLFYAIRDRSTGRAAGVASYLRITPAHGTIEVGHINLSPALQRTRAATEAMFLMMDWVFSAGYRRYEWKCDALNLPSRRSAQRLGFSYEGTFRHHMIYKGRNRDTAWFAITDGDWPALRAAFGTWLAPANFEGDRQVRSLRSLTRPLLAAADPQQD
jgi:RimJ/RimL family protein N-acetyltransferase